MVSERVPEREAEDELATLRSARSRSDWRQADDALVEDIGAYGEGRGSSYNDHQYHRGKHDEKPATTALERHGNARTAGGRSEPCLP